MSMMDGTITWADAGAVHITLGLTGPHVKITNKQGALATDTMSLDAERTITWSKATDEFADAQLISFVAASTAKKFVAHAPQPEPRVARRSDSGDRQREPDVQRVLDGQRHPLLQVEHAVREHGPHHRRRLSRVRSLGSRAVDHRRRQARSTARSVKAWPTRSPHRSRTTMAWAAASSSQRHALRDLDPVGARSAWPEDADGEVHDEGEIIGETLWDVRKALEAKYGAVGRLRQVPRDLQRHHAARVGHPVVVRRGARRRRR